MTTHSLALLLMSLKSGGYAGSNKLRAMKVAPSERLELPIPSLGQTEISTVIARTLDKSFMTSFPAGRFWT